MASHLDIAGMNPADYAELLDHLRKDLQLDARTDLQSGTVLASLFDQSGSPAFVQLGSATPGGLKQTYGGASFTGNASNVVTVTVASGLSVVRYFEGTASSTPTVGQFFIGAWSASGGTVTAQALLPFGTYTNGATYSFNWIALGS